MNAALTLSPATPSLIVLAREYIRAVQTFEVHAHLTPDNPRWRAAKEQQANALNAYNTGVRQQLGVDITWSLTAARRHRQALWLIALDGMAHIRGCTECGEVAGKHDTYCAECGTHLTTPIVDDL